MADQVGIGFVGTGNMGEPIARSLLQAGHPLTIWNRTRGKVASLVSEGAIEAWDPAEACSAGGIVFTMLSDDRALEQVVESRGFLERLAPGGIHVSMSTVSPATSRRLAERHAEEHSAYVAAPVFGRPDAAAARKLWVCVSGSGPALERVVPLLRAVSQGLFEMGEDPGAANVAKLCGNFLIAAAMEAMSEAFTLGEKNGIEPHKLADLFARTLFACPIYQNYGKTIAEGRFKPAGFALPLGLKDMGLVLAMANSSKTPMPLAGLVRDRLLSGMALGREDHDWSALSLGAREEAGLSRAYEPMSSK